MAFNPDTLTEEQQGKATSVNELMRAIKRIFLGGVRGFGQTAGLTWKGYGGYYDNGGTPTELGNWSITLADNSNNYIYWDPNNVATNSGVGKSTSGFPPGCEPLFVVAVTFGVVSGVTDYIAAPGFSRPSRALVLSSDANRTLDAFECRAEILDVSSSVSLTATRDIVVPVAYPRSWIVTNGTSGAQKIRVIGASGTGVEIDNGSTAVVYSNGTNVIAVAGGGGGGPDLSGAIAFPGIISPAQITADQNDYSPAGLSAASTLRLSSDASRNITGLAGGAAGRLILIHNVGANAIVLKDESAGSTAANRFALTADLSLAADAVALLQYDSTSSRWRAISGGAGGGGGGTIGRHMIPIAARAMSPRSSNGCAALAISAGASNQPDYEYLAFDPSAVEYAEFSFDMPESWDEGTVTFEPIWAHPSTATNFGVVWSL